MSADTESIRIDVAGMVLSPARKFGGSYLCTMHPASEVFAMDALGNVSSMIFRMNVVDIFVD